jgi:hypothetical protein
MQPKNQTLNFFSKKITQSVPFCTSFLAESKDVIKDDFGGKLPSGRSRTSSGRPPASAYTPRTRFLSADGFLPSADSVKTASARTRKSIRADATMRLHGRTRVRADTSASAQTLGCVRPDPHVRADAAQHPRIHGRPRERISLLSPPPSPSLPSAVRANAKNKIK